MTVLEIQELEVELVTIESAKYVHVVQFRFRHFDDTCFTYEMVLSRTPLVWRRGYGSSADALLADARLQVEEHLAQGRYEDLVLVRPVTGWMPPVAPVIALQKHTSHYDVA